MLASGNKQLAAPASWLLHEGLSMGMPLGFIGVRLARNRAGRRTICERNAIFWRTPETH
jgi:hypothetical protein